MAFFLDIKGQSNIYITDDDIPRIGESIKLIADTLDGQEGALQFIVTEVIYTFGPGYVTELPVVILEAV
jgi:hypothetical protein